MGLGDKIENAAEKAGGKGKEAAGAATGDESLRTEGQADQAKGDLKQADQTTEKDAPSERGASFCLPRIEANQEWARAISAVSVGRPGPPADAHPRVLLLAYSGDT
jgi:uncharacterized protein YjbJ (UPF0337 family)